MDGILVNRKTQITPSITRICLVGDSMIEGVSGVGTGTGFRAELWTYLLANVGKVSFVGASHDAMLSPATGAWTLGEYWTEGHGGKRIEDIEVLCQAGIIANQPDVIVICAGTNNVSLSESAALVLTRIGHLIDTVRRCAPQCKHVLVSTILPYRNGTWAPIQAVIDTVNAALPALCYARGAVCVNALGSLDAATHLHSDNIHANAAGNTVVAGILGAAIKGRIRASSSDLLYPHAFATYAATCLAPSDYNHAAGEIAYDADQQIGAHKFTMAVWFRVTNLNAYGSAMNYTIVKHGETSATTFVMRYKDTGVLDIYFGASNLMSWTGLVAENTWYRFVVSCDGTYVYAWLNGKYLGRSSSVAGYNLADTGVTRLGRGVDLAHGYGLVGQVTDLIFCRDDADDWRVPTTRDIMADYYDGIRLPGCRGWWKMLEGSGGTFSDSQSRCGSGTVSGTWATVARP